MSLKVLVYGSRGWIGGQFLEVLHKKNVVFVEGLARADDVGALAEEMDRVRPTHVVSFIGRTHGIVGDKVYPTIDYLEEKGKLCENVRDNLFSPLVLALACKERDVHYTYLGTGCIFTYDENHPYGRAENGFSETSLPNFFGSGYSVVKGFTDQLMQLFPDNVLNLRIRMPITNKDHARNFITKIVNYEKVCSVPNSMSVLDELLPCVVDLMEKRHTGTLNFTNPGLVSHNEILEMYKEVVDPEFSWQNFSVEEQDKVLSAGRSNNYLKTSNLEELCPSVRPIKEAVRAVLEEGDFRGGAR
jgi:3,5-epimerase/4-reductase